MTRSERADYVLGELMKLYPVTPIPLDHHDSFTLLVAVLHSAQCTDKRVNIVTPGLFRKADTPELMVRLAVEEIREIIRPCGLSPRKARAIRELSANRSRLGSGFGHIVPRQSETCNFQIPCMSKRVLRVSTSTW